MGIIGLIRALVRRAGARAGGDVDRAVLVLQAYSNSFVGLGVDEVSSLLAPAEPVRARWEEGGVGGTRLQYDFPAHQLLLFESDGKVVTASVQLLSR